MIVVVLCKRTGYRTTQQEKQVFCHGSNRLAGNFENDWESRQTFLLTATGIVRPDELTCAKLTGQYLLMDSRRNRKHQINELKANRVRKDDIFLQVQIHRC